MLLKQVITTIQECIHGDTSWCVLAIAFSAILFKICIKNDRSTSPVPSHPGSWIFGHTFLLPKARPWERLWEWGNQCGGLFQISVLGTKIVVVNNYNVADSLLNKFASSSMIRPFRTMAYLTGYDLGLGFLTGGPRLKETRRLLHKALGPRPVRDLYGNQINEAHKFVRNLLKYPTELHPAIRLMSSSSMLYFTLGYNVQSMEDPVIVQSEAVAANISLLLSPGNFWVDAFPMARFLPLCLMGRRIRNTVHTYRNDLKNLFRLYEKEVDYNRKQISDLPPLSTQLLRELPSENEKYHKDIIRYAMVTIYGGAVETTVAATSTFFLLMILYPDIQKRAREEIDAVIGYSRLPTHDDRSNLPYIEAVLKEVLRWNPPVPLTTREVEDQKSYHSYHITPGSKIMANIWGMTHDSSIFPEPHKFLPERFLHRDPSLPDIYNMVFGFGRRICPGSHYAKSALWIMVATVLATLEISAPVRDGIIILPTLECEDGGLMKLHPFEYVLKPRPNVYHILD